MWPPKPISQNEKQWKTNNSSQTAAYMYLKKLKIEEHEHQGTMEVLAVTVP